MLKKNMRVIKFLVSGGSSAGVEYGVFLLLSMLLHTPLLTANTGSFLCGLVVSFVLNKAWVFPSKGKARRQFILYLALAAVNLMIANALIWLFVEYWGMYSLVAKVAIMAAIAVWNYLLFSRVLFKPVTTPQDSLIGGSKGMMSSMKRMPTSVDTVAVIIPAYNEGEAIRHTLEDILKYFPHVICIDDGSDDDTVAQIENTSAILVRHPLNLGQGAALQTGIEYALLDPRIKYFVTYDADGQHRAEDVFSMLNHLKKNKLDIVLGSRFLGSAENMSTEKRLLLKLAVAFSNISTGVHLTDTHNGLRVFNRHTAKSLRLKMPDFSHASEIVERIREKKLKYEEIPVTILYTDYSRRKGQSMINAVNISFDVLINKLLNK